MTELNRAETLKEFKKYVNKDDKDDICDMRPYVKGEDLSEIEVSKMFNPEKDMGMIARDSKDYKDMWYISRQYFEKTFEDYFWIWEDAFNKFGFGDGDDPVYTQDVEDTLRKEGYETESVQWGLHNTVIDSIKKNGVEFVPQGKLTRGRPVLGYDNPRKYLPEKIIKLLDDKLKSSASLPWLPKWRTEVYIKDETHE